MDRNVSLVDPARVDSVHRTGLIGVANKSFDRLGDLARRLTSSPTALVTLIDMDAQYFVSCLGVPTEVASAVAMPLTHSICQYTLESLKPLVIGDTRDLAASAMSEIQLREALIEGHRVAAVLAASEARLRAMLDGLFIFVGTEQFYWIG